ncbi:hypothetical protein [Paenibacillus sp. KR2-11]|nr:hypothetical protein [Paenibacillus caseinilyticus]
MRKGIMLLLLAVLLTFGAGCTADKKPAQQPGSGAAGQTGGATDAKEAWHPTVDEAVQAGLAAEKGKLLSVEKDEAETFVFYTPESGAPAGALGVGSITKGEQGYRWFRGEDYHVSSSVDVPFDSMSFTAKAESGHTVKVYAGRVYDASVKRMNLLDGGAVVQSKEVADPKTGLYYFMVERRKVPEESGAMEVKPAV